MCGAVSPLPQYAFMAWCSVKAQGQVYLLPLPVPPRFPKLSLPIPCYTDLLPKSHSSDPLETDCKYEISGVVSAEYFLP
jgi:hypothetical protein